MPSDFALPPDLVTAHAASLRALARSLALDEHAADDVVQETWLRALSSPPARSDGIGGWLRRVTGGFALQRRRSEARRADRERRYARERPEAVTSSETRAETLRQVVEAVLSLEEPYRETVLLRWFESLPPRDIAARQRTSVATVQSRLQRAHALLRERLSRRLGIDQRALRGVLLAIFGAGTASTAAAATTISLWGATMTMKLVAAAGIAAIVLGWIYFPGGGDERVEPPPLLRASAEAPSVPDMAAPVEPADLPQRVELAAEPAATPAAIATPVEPGPFEFDVTVIPIDPDGRPVPNVRVHVGLEQHALAHLGTTGWNGELRTTWRGFEPELDMVLELRGAGADDCPLRRIRLVAGAPETVVIAVGPTGASVRIVRLKQMRTEMMVAQRPSATATFSRDAAGNGVFDDPWTLRPDGPGAQAQSELAREISLVAATSGELRQRFTVLRSDKGPAKDSDATRIEGIVRDEFGRPLPGVLVTALTESDSGRRSATTDAEGRFACAMTSGRAIVFVGGGDRVMLREEIELEQDQVRAFELQCPSRETTRVRLLDDEGKPLAGWRMETRTGDANGALVARAQTDEAGFATLPALRNAQRRILVHPTDPARTAAMVLDAHAVDRGGVLDYALRDSPRSGEISIAVHGPKGLPVEARVWRTDSNEGLRMSLVGAPGSDDARSVLQVAGLLPGEYVIELGAPCVTWKRVGPFFLQPGQKLDAGSFTIEEPARVTVVVPDATTAPTVRASTRVQGLDFHRREFPGMTSGQLLLAPGEWTLTVESADATGPRTLVGPRRIQAVAGQAVELGAAKDESKR